MAKVKATIRDGRGLMPAFRQFSDRDLDALVALIRSTPDDPDVASSSNTLEQQLMSEGARQLARAAREKGNARRGAIVFHQPQTACSKCHSASHTENPLGPDLTALPDETTDLHLVESILEPSKAIRRGYEPVTLLLSDGPHIDGIHCGRTKQLGCVSRSLGGRRDSRDLA